MLVRGREEIHEMNRSDDVAEWIRICGREEQTGRQKTAVKIAAFQEWKHSWTHQKNSGHSTPANPETWKAANFTMDKNTGRFTMNYREAPVQIHQNLSRAQSSIAI